MKKLPAAAATYGPRLVAAALSAVVAFTLAPIVTSGRAAPWQRAFAIVVFIFFCYMFFRSAARWRAFFGASSKRP